MKCKCVRIWFYWVQFIPTPVADPFLNEWMNEWVNSFILVPTCEDQTALRWLGEDGIIDTQLRLRFWGDKVLRGGEGLGHVHHHGDGRRGRVLGQEERKDVAEDVALRLVGILFGQEGEIPGSTRTEISLGNKILCVAAVLLQLLVWVRGGVWPGVLAPHMDEFEERGGGVGALGGEAAHLGGKQHTGWEGWGSTCATAQRSGETIKKWHCCLSSHFKKRAICLIHEVG